MFSEMIQNMLNSGGKSAAMKRATQINNYANYSNIHSKSLTFIVFHLEISGNEVKDEHPQNIFNI